ARQSGTHHQGARLRAAEVAALVAVVGIDLRRVINPESRQGGSALGASVCGIRNSPARSHAAARLFYYSRITGARRDCQSKKVARKMSTYNVKMEGSEQERQLLEVLRDHDGDAASDFRLLVQKQDGAWDVTLSIAPHDQLNTSRGTGSTFDDAWDNMAPLWA